MASTSAISQIIYMPKHDEVTQRNKICQGIAALSCFAALAALVRVSQRSSLWIAGSVAVITGISLILIKRIDISDKKETTSLIRAAMNGQQVWSKILLFFGANPNHQNGYQLSPVYWSARNEDVSLLKTLIAAGGNVQAVLFPAVQNLRPGVVKMLLAHNADPKRIYEGAEWDYPLAHAKRLQEQVRNKEYTAGDGSSQESIEKDVADIVRMLAAAG